MHESGKRINDHPTMAVFGVAIGLEALLMIVSVNVLYQEWFFNFIAWIFREEHVGMIRVSRSSPAITLINVLAWLMALGGLILAAISFSQPSKRQWPIAGCVLNGVVLSQSLVWFFILR